MRLLLGQATPAGETGRLQEVVLDDLGVVTFATRNALVCDVSCSRNTFSTLLPARSIGVLTSGCLSPDVHTHRLKYVQDIFLFLIPTNKSESAPTRRGFTGVDNLCLPSEASLWLITLCLPYEIMVHNTTYPQSHH